MLNGVVVQIKYAQKRYLLKMGTLLKDRVCYVANIYIYFYIICKYKIIYKILILIYLPNIQHK